MAIAGNKRSEEFNFTRWISSLRTIGTASRARKYGSCAREGKFFSFATPQWKVLRVQTNQVSVRTKSQPSACSPWKVDVRENELTLSIPELIQQFGSSIYSNEAIRSIVFSDRTPTIFEIEYLPKQNPSRTKEDTED